VDIGVKTREHFRGDVGASGLVVLGARVVDAIVKPEGKLEKIGPYREAAEVVKRDEAGGDVVEIVVRARWRGIQGVQA
jgi:hypothetical protein